MSRGEGRKRGRRITKDPVGRKRNKGKRRRMKARQRKKGIDG